MAATGGRRSVVARQPIAKTNIVVTLVSPDPEQRQQADKRFWLGMMRFGSRCGQTRFRSKRCAVKTAHRALEIASPHSSHRNNQIP
jgi:hypothetical protein